MPLREGIAQDVYLVTTADFMSLYAANNICRGIARYAKENEVRLAGIFYNARSGWNNPALAERFAQAIGTTVAGYLPMSEAISRAELERKTVVEAFPESHAAQCFRTLAHKMLEGGIRCIPRPMAEEEVETLCRR